VVAMFLRDYGPTKWQGARVASWLMISVYLTTLSLNCPYIEIIRRKAAGIFARISSIVRRRYGEDQLLLVAGGRA
jgi:hypothetical protein